MSRLLGSAPAGSGGLRWYSGAADVSVQDTMLSIAACSSRPRAARAAAALALALMADPAPAARREATKAARAADLHRAAVSRQMLADPHVRRAAIAQLEEAIALDPRPEYLLALGR